MKKNPSTFHFQSPANTLRIEVVITCFLFLLLVPIALFGQKSKEQLEQEKRENLRKIAEAEKILSETESQRKVTIGQLNAINQQIRAREGLISSLEGEISLFDNEIDDRENIPVLFDAYQMDPRYPVYCDDIFVTWIVTKLEFKIIDSSDKVVATAKGDPFKLGSRYENKYISRKWK